MLISMTDCTACVHTGVEVLWLLVLGACNKVRAVYGADYSRVGANTAGQLLGLILLGSSAQQAPAIVRQC
jgi:hypothetical protein